MAGIQTPTLLEILNAIKQLATPLGPLLALLQEIKPIVMGIKKAQDEASQANAKEFKAVNASIKPLQNALGTIQGRLDKMPARLEATATAAELEKVKAEVKKIMDKLEAIAKADAKASKLSSPSKPDKKATMGLDPMLTKADMTSLLGGVPTKAEIKTAFDEQGSKLEALAGNIKNYGNSDRIGAVSSLFT